MLFRRKGADMSFYKLFYTDRQVPADRAPNLAMILPLEFGSVEEALNKAFKLIHDGAIVWKIEGPQGFNLDRTEIERRYKIFKNT